jgi:hypothetical protein
VTCLSCQTNPSSCSGLTGCRLNTYYPPAGVPAVSFADLQNNGHLASVVAFQDGTVRAFSSAGSQLWMFDFAADAGVNNQNEVRNVTDLFCLFV